ncbi:MAG TPA: AMP phosphorylase [Candidatus Methanofastidiosa archaeon]|nr:AMP phosphorylase [Candidatus Methanofastidiosa archaeon]HPR42383.1 AMP phosphorylase [Candidatus Methanofastidiosa archaeon]
MDLTVKKFDLEAGKRYTVIMNERDMLLERIHSGDRVMVTGPADSIKAFVNSTKKVVKKGEVGLFQEVSEKTGLNNNGVAKVEFASLPDSVHAIRKKMKGERLSKEQIFQIVFDVVEQNLSEAEIAAFLVSQQTIGMDIEEVEYLTRAMADYGEKAEYEKTTFTKHSVGGVPGDSKVSLINVPIVAAGGLFIPKTSSRAITSPSGTSDTMEVLSEVEFSIEEIKEIAKKSNAALAWGGSLNMAPADDMLIRVERPLKLDPLSQMLASIMSKQIANDVDFMLLDIPVGKGAKVETEVEARKIAASFRDLADRLGIYLRTVITYGGQPVGHAIGPALEAIEALDTLSNKGPASVTEKSIALSGVMFEMGGLAANGQGNEMAKKLLTSGKALEKFLQIIELQGGNPKIKKSDIQVGDKTFDILAKNDGYITRVSNDGICKIAHLAGAPKDKGAGIYLHRKVGYYAKQGEPLFTIYSESEKKLDDAINHALKHQPISIEGMIIEEL